MIWQGPNHDMVEVTSDNEQPRSEVIPSSPDGQIIDLTISGRTVAEYYVIGRTSVPVL